MFQAGKEIDVPDKDWLKKNTGILVICVESQSRDPVLSPATL
jgi:hypothetical protein